MLIIIMLYVLATFCIVSAKGYSVQNRNDKVLNSDTEELRWPDTYSVKATSYSLTSNVVEEYTAWRTINSSRIDYNQGAVKVITSLVPDKKSHGQKFEIYPETTEKELNKIVCYKRPEGWSHVELDQVFPALSNVQNFKVVGKETIGITKTVKFEKTFKTKSKDQRETLWAFHFGGHGWFPVRYELELFNGNLGSLQKHEIWHFSDCSVEVDNEVFDTSKFHCDTNAIQHTPDSEKITKELLFINPEKEKHVDHIYNHFQNKYERKFGHKDEQTMRKDIFKENMKMISSVNRRNLGYKLEVNKFSDWTDEELERSLGEIPNDLLEGLTASVPFPYNESEVNNIASKLLKQYDMRFNGFISPVKDQGECGSCWTFAAAAVTESGLARVNGGKVLALSNQAIMDCASRATKETHGCHGGSAPRAYDFIKEHGLPTEEEYGLYKKKDGYCRIEEMTKTYHITNYTKVPHDNYNAMMVALVEHGPLYVTAHITKEFHHYSSGIFKPRDIKCRKPKKSGYHAMAMVGYGEKDGELFWILKNSWGTRWGIDGYVLIDPRKNDCSGVIKSSYPVF